MAILITERRTYSCFAPTHGRAFFLSELVEILGGTPRTLPNDRLKGKVVWGIVQDDALIDQRHENPVAALMLGYIIRGPILITTPEEAAQAKAG